MKLLYSAASPFVRKCVVFAHEAGLFERLELIDAAAHPINKNEEIYSLNPLGKVPALILDDQRVLFDSRVICEYLDGLLQGELSLYGTGPDHKKSRMDILVLQAIGDGMMDAAVGSRYEAAARPEDKVWNGWIEAQLGKVASACDFLNKMDVAELCKINAGTISVACALAYLDFRHPGFDWRVDRPVLVEMYEHFSKRNSMSSTEPVG